MLGKRIRVIRITEKQCEYHVTEKRTDILIIFLLLLFISCSFTMAWLMIVIPYFPASFFSTMGVIWFIVCSGFWCATLIYFWLYYRSMNEWKRIRLESDPCRIIIERLSKRKERLISTREFPFEQVKDIALKSHPIHTEVGVGYYYTARVTLHEGSDQHLLRSDEYKPTSILVMLIYSWLNKDHLYSEILSRLLEEPRRFQAIIRELYDYTVDG